MYQNDSIPGFPSIESFKYVVTIELNKLRQPAIDLVSDVSNYVRSIYCEATRQRFEPYGELMDFVLNIVEEYMEEMTQQTLELVLVNVDS